MGNRQQLGGLKLCHLPLTHRGRAESGKDRVHASVPSWLFEQVGQEEDAVPALPISYYSHKLIFDTSHTQRKMHHWAFRFYSYCLAFFLR